MFFMFFQRAWSDAKKFRNLDLSIAVVLGLFFAVTVPILGILSSFLAPDKALLLAVAVLLGMMSLLAAGILNSRWLQEEGQSLLSKFCWRHFHDDVKTRLRSAKKVCILGVSPLGFLRDYQEELQNILSVQGGKVHFLYVKQDSDAMNLIRLGREENVKDSEQLLKEITRILKPKALQNSKSELVVKSINFVPSSIITLIDDETNKGVIFATVYSFKQTSNRLAQPITNKDQDKFVFYKQEFKDLWESETANLELTV